MKKKEERIAETLSKESDLVNIWKDVLVKSMDPAYVTGGKQRTQP